MENMAKKMEKTYKGNNTLFFPSLSVTPLETGTQTLASSWKPPRSRGR